MLRVREPSGDPHAWPPRARGRRRHTITCPDEVLVPAAVLLTMRPLPARLAQCLCNGVVPAPHPPPPPRQVKYACQPGGPTGRECAMSATVTLRPPAPPTHRGRSAPRSTAIFRDRNNPARSSLGARRARSRIPSAAARARRDLRRRRRHPRRYAVPPPSCRPLPQQCLTCSLQPAGRGPCRSPAHGLIVRSLYGSHDNMGPDSS